MFVRVGGNTQRNEECMMSAEESCVDGRLRCGAGPAKSRFKNMELKVQVECSSG